MLFYCVVVYDYLWDTRNPWLEDVVFSFDRVLAENAANRLVQGFGTGNLYTILRHEWRCRLVFGAILPSQHDESFSETGYFRAELARNYVGAMASIVWVCLF